MNTTYRICRQVSCVLLLHLGISGAPLAAAESPTVPAVITDPGSVLDPTTLPAVVQQAQESVVLITVQDRDGGQAGIGTGFVVDPNGLIATNLHVLGEARPITVRLRNGKECAVTEIHASDHHLDLAIIRVAEQQLKPLPLAIDESLLQGQPIVALGNPMGLRNSIVSGVVSGRRQIDGRRMIQIAMPIEPGNSGGPVLNLDGQVVGIVTLKSVITPNLGFAMEVSALRSLLQQPNPIPIDRWETIGALDSLQWTQRLGGRWQQRAGRIIISEPAPRVAGRALCLWQEAVPEGEYEVGAYVRLEQESGAAGLVFGVEGENRHYGFYPSDGRLRLTRFHGPTVFSWKVLEERTSPSYRPGEWNHLKVRIAEGRVACYVNDQLVIERSAQGLSTGQVGLARFRQTGAEFRDFRLQRQIPPTQLPETQRQRIRQQLAALQIDDWLSTADVQRLSDDAQASVAVLEQEARQLQRQAVRLQRLAQDVHLRDICQELERLFEKPEAEIDLVRSALLISRLDNRDLDVDAYVAQVDRMAHEIQISLEDSASPDQRLQALNQYLFTANGFHGSRTNYYHEANSYFDRVLDDREGLPITLCLLYMELGRRLDLRIEGIGLPGHFVVRYVPPEGEPQLLDVFHAGVPMSLTDAELLTIQVTGLPFRNEYLRSTSKREVVVRILRNLLGVAQRGEDKEAMLRYLEAMVTIEPQDPALRGMRAILRHETGRRQAAVEDLDWFLQQPPGTVDVERIRAIRSRFQQRDSTIEDRLPIDAATFSRPAPDSR